MYFHWELWLKDGEEGKKLASENFQAKNWDEARMLVEEALASIPEASHLLDLREQGLEFDEVNTHPNLRDLVLVLDLDRYRIYIELIETFLVAVTPEGISAPTIVSPWEDPCRKAMNLLEKILTEHNHNPKKLKIDYEFVEKPPSDIDEALKKLTGGFREYGYVKMLYVRSHSKLYDSFKVYTINVEYD